MGELSQKLAIFSFCSQYHKAPPGGPAGKIASGNPSHPAILRRSAPYLVSTYEAEAADRDEGEQLGGHQHQ